VEDDPRVASFVAKGLREQAYAVDVARDGEEAAYLGTENQYDLIILDIMLPGKDGHAVCRELRASGGRMPILMLTARGAIDDRVEGLDSGADDYLVKPFAFKELLARMRALLRRSAVFRPPLIEVASLKLNTANHAVTHQGRPIALTAKEYALLEFLVVNHDRVVGREEIAQHVWDENFDPFSNVIDVYIKRLRAKLDAGPDRRLIHTRRGEGYLLTAHAEASGRTADV